MGYFYKSYIYNRIIAIGTTSAFVLNSLLLTNVHSSGLNTYKEAQFAMRIEKLINKVYKYKDRMDEDKILDTLKDWRIKKLLARSFKIFSKKNFKEISVI